METPKVIGQKRSTLYFNKIDIYDDRMEAKGIFLPKKVIPLQEIQSWIEINKKHPQVNFTWQELTIFTNKTKYLINSRHWINYEEMRAAIVTGKPRDTAKEAKIYGR